MGAQGGGGVPGLRARRGRWLVAGVAAVSALTGTLAAPPVWASAPGRPALSAGPGQMADAAVAVDPAEPMHLAAVADPYSGGVHIELTESRDGGHTWSPPLRLLPPGTTKSFDPTVLILGDGRLVVVGGASGTGRAFCQPASRVFVATVADGKASFDIVQPPRPAVYVDRPTATTDPTSNTVVLSWTESSGAGAECLGLPAKATVFVRQWGDGSACPAPRPLGSTGSPSAFGAGLARAGGSVVAAVRELGSGTRSRLAVSASSDGGCTFGAPQLVDEGPQAPAKPAATGGFAVGVASAVLSPDGSVTVAWSVASGTGVSTRVLRRPGGQPDAGFTSLAAPADVAAVELVPTLVADRAGGVWLATASARPGGLAFLVRRWAGAWAPTVTVVTGSTGRYQELGQGLGLAAAGPVLAVAVPLNGPASSSLIVATEAVPDPPRRPEAPRPNPARPPSTEQAAPDGAIPSAPGRGPGSPRGVGLTEGVAGSLMVILVIVVVTRRRQRSRRGSPADVAGGG